MAPSDRPSRLNFEVQRAPPNHCMQPTPQPVIKFACANLPPVWCAADGWLLGVRVKVVPSISLNRVWTDDDSMLWVKLSANNGEFGAGLDFYVYPQQLRDFG